MADALFEPFTCRSLHLRNRIVMAPMTRMKSPGGIPTQSVADYYAARAAGEVGLIVTEGTGIERPAAKNEPDVPDFFGAALPAWGRVAAAVHGQGGSIVPQLWHVGARPSDARPDLPPLGKTDSPSALAWPGREVGKAMSEEDIADVIAAFAEAAANARRLGFDGVELHGAHGYLFDQFFWDKTNLRTDRWGGATLAERARFAVETIKAVRAAVGPDLAIIFRISQDKSPDGSIRLANSPAEMESWLAPLAVAGADIFHCSGTRYWRSEFDGSDLNFAGWAKKLTGLPTITVGSVGLALENGPEAYKQPVPPASLDDVVRRLERGDFDLVAIGRALITDPEWPRKIRQGQHVQLKGFDAKSMAHLV